MKDEIHLTKKDLKIEWFSTEDHGNWVKDIERNYCSITHLKSNIKVNSTSGKNSFGKISFGKEKLLENLTVYMHAIAEVKPTSLKGTYINSITLSTSMGPGLKLDISKVLEAVK